MSEASEWKPFKIVGIDVSRMPDPSPPLDGHTGVRGRYTVDVPIALDRTPPEGWQRVFGLIWAVVAEKEKLPAVTVDGPALIFKDTTLEAIDDEKFKHHLKKTLQDTDEGYVGDELVKLRLKREAEEVEKEKRRKRQAFEQKAKDIKF